MTVLQSAGGVKAPVRKRNKGHVKSQMIRESNRNYIIRLMHKHGVVAKAEVADRIGLSRVAVNDIIGNLIEHKLIEEVGVGESTGGRKPVLYRLNPSGAHVVAVDMGLEQMRLGIVDLEANVKAEVTVKTNADQGARVAFDGVAEVLKDLLAESGVQRDDVLGLGLAFPGAMWFSGDECIVASSGLGWDNIPARKIMENQTGLTCFLDSNVKARALGEHWFGLARDIHNFVCLHVHGGVGVAVVLDGRIYRGHHGSAGCLGHNSIVPDGKPCFCGNRGCLAAYVSGRSIVETVREGVRNGEKTVLRAGDGESRSKVIDQLFQAAEQGDGFAREIVDEIVKHLTIGIAGLVNNFDPGIVILSGYMIEKSRGMIMGRVQDNIRKLDYDDPPRTSRIKESRFGDRAGIIGAASLVFQHYFEVPLVRN